MVGIHVFSAACLRSHDSVLLYTEKDAQDLGISIDASTSWGISVVIGTQWDAWQWSAPCHFDGGNIR
jgi:hypothetical protein